MVCWMRKLRDLFDIYKGLSIQAKASFWFVVSTVLMKGISFITVPIFTRVMTTDQYGLYSVYLTWYQLLSVIGTLSLETCSYMSVLTKFEEEKKGEAQASLLGLSFFITILLLVIVLIFGEAISFLMGLPKAMIVFMLIQICFVPVVNFWSVRSRFQYRYMWLLFVSLSMAIFNALLGVVFVIAFSQDYQAYGRIISIVLVQIVYGVALLYLLTRGHKFSFTTRYWKWAIKLHIPLLPHMLSLKVLGSSDKIMINMMIGATATALYSAVYSIAIVINLIKTSIVDAMRPWMYQKMQTKEYDEIRSVIKGVLIFVALLTMVFVAFAPEVLYIVTPKKYHVAVYCMPPIMISSFFTFLYSVFSIVELYYEETKKVMVASVSVAAINIILNYILIPVFGYIVAAFTTLVCYICLSLFHALMVKQISEKYDISKDLFGKKFVFVLSAGLIVLMLLFEYLYTKTIYRYLFLFILFVVVFVKRNYFINLLRTIKNKK